MANNFEVNVYFDGYALVDNSLLVNAPIFSIITIEIMQFFPYECYEQYGIQVLNLQALLATDAYCYRHLLLYAQPNQKKICAFLDNLAKRCNEQGIIWDSLLGYAEHESDNWYFPGNRDLGPVIAGFEPKWSWYIENGRDLEGCSDFFDERIIFDITWPNEHGYENYFRGYWYAASTAYIIEKLKTQDPYYRRFIYIAKVFSTTVLEACLNRTRKHLSQTPLEDRITYLKRHFEYDGQVMLYER